MVRGADLVGFRRTVVVLGCLSIWVHWTQYMFHIEGESYLLTHLIDGNRSITSTALTQRTMWNTYMGQYQALSKSSAAWDRKRKS